MTDFLPFDFVNGTTADADEIQANFEALEAKYPIAAVDIGGVNSSTINWDVDPPTSSGGGGGGSFVGGSAAILATPLYTTGLQQTFERHDNVLFPTGSEEECGWASPFYRSGSFGALVPSAQSDKVHFVSTNPTVGIPGGNILSWQLESGATPVHAVGAPNGDIYVACQYAAGAMISKIDASGTITNGWLDLSATYSSIERIAIDRFGRWLFAICKDTGDTNHRTVVAVVVSDKTYSHVQAGADYQLSDITLHHASALAYAQVEVICAQQTSATSVGLILRQSYSGTAWTGTNMSTLYSNPTGQAGEVLTSCVSWGQGLFVLGYYGAVTGLCWAFLRGPDGLSDTSVVFSGTDTTITDETLPGALCYDGRGFHGLVDTGHVVHYTPGAVSLVKYEAKAGMSDAGGTYIKQSSITFNGRNYFAWGVKSGATDGEGQLFIPW